MTTVPPHDLLALVAPSAEGTEATH